MKNNFLNWALAVTGMATFVVLIVFFIKLNNTQGTVGAEDTKNESSRDKDSGSGLSALTGKKQASSVSGDKAGSEKTADTSDSGKDENSDSRPEEEDPDTGKDGQEDDVPTPSPTEPPEVTDEPVQAEKTVYSTYPVDISGIDPEKPIVAMTFDDGPSQNTDSILETLAEYGGHATFFMVGENIDMYPERVRNVYEAGCEVANHTINHKELMKLSKEEVKFEVEGNQDKLNAVLGTEIDFLVRPPYGDTNDAVKAAIGHPLIIWWVDTLDWKSKNADAVFEEVKKTVKDGCIILMHDIYQSTAQAVKKVVPWLKEQGYQICSVSEMYAARGQKLENGVRYNSTISAKEYKEKKEGSV